MTTTPAPIPDHGTEGRYKGTRSGSRPPCRCTKCTRANRLAGIRRARARAAGRELVISRDTLLPHIQTLRDSGMSQALIARHANVSQTTISYLINGKIKGCQRDKAHRILAVRPAHFDDIAERSSVGATRRIQALYTLAHGRDTISAASGVSPCTIGQIANQRYQRIDGSIDAAIRHAYRLLSDTAGTSGKAKRRAAAQGWAPPGAWDDIDHPNALPDWTGHCGTDRGWWMHSLQKLPTCQPCDQAHTQWRQAHAHLNKDALLAALGKARAQASNRGQDIAEDARELLRLDVTHDVIADRLGITKVHLYQELKRHPHLEAAA